MQEILNIIIVDTLIRTPVPLHIHANIQSANHVAAGQRIYRSRTGLSTVFR